MTTTAMVCRVGEGSVSVSPECSMIRLLSVAAVLLAGLAQSGMAEEASELVRATGLQGGFIVQVGISNPESLRELKLTDAIQVHALDADPDMIRDARMTLRQSGEYGDISVDRWTGGQLPYVDNLVNVLVIDAAEAVSNDELLRVLVPRGIAFVRQQNGSWETIVKPWPDEIDEWSHYLHDATGNSVAHDDRVGPPRHLQWVGSPRWSRHHDRMASMSALVSTNGRMFSIQDEGSRISIQLPSHWKLIARDAFNGTILWKRDIPEWQNHLWPLKSGPSQLTRRLVSTQNEVLVTLGIHAPISVLDAATGKTLRTLPDSAGAEELITTGGQLFAVVNREGKTGRDAYVPLNGGTGDQALVRNEFFWNEEPRILMGFDLVTGEQKWAKSTKISPMTMAADDTHVYIHDGERVIAVHQQTGDIVWQTDPVTRRKQFTFNFGPRLVLFEDVVLFAGGDNKLLALNAANGDELWTSDYPNSGYQSPQDLMVINGLVWLAPLTSGRDSGEYVGRDVKTGEIKQRFAPDVETYWFHHRCYIAKGTDNFLMPSRTGIEFVDFNQEKWNIHHWVRGGCLYGVMPCNGLTYAPPHNCACYPEAKLFGFNALASAAPTRPVPSQVPEEGRLETGPAYETPLAAQSPQEAQEDWPTYRGDGLRSGAVVSAVSENMTARWSVQLGGELTPPVIARGQVYVAQKNQHTLHAFDEQSGDRRWSYTIGARIDSPPTIAHGRVVFGGADGWVYCLNAQSGALAWRYRAAPLDRRTMAFEQLESLWPVHGSVLILDQTIYTVAGRSNFLDGGLRLLRLDLRSGKKLSETILDETNPETGNNLQELLKVLQMPVGLPDVLSTDGRYIYMRSQKFDLAGNRLEIGPISGDFVEQGSAQSGDGVHLFAPMGFLDDTWFHRAYWVNGRSFAGGHAGYYQAGKFAPAGRILVNGGGYVFGYGRKPQYYKWTTVLEHQLFAAPPEPPEFKQPQPQPKGNARASYVDFKISKSLNPQEQPITVEAWFNATKPNGVIIARGGPTDGFALALSKGSVQFHIRSENTLKTIADDKRVVGGWHHVVGVLDTDAKMTLYVDGKQVATGQAPGLIASDPKQGLQIASDEGTGVGDYKGPNGFTGAIDEVRLYFAAVDAAAVQARFQNNDELHPDPRLVISFDDDTARDLSTYRNDGNIQNGKPVPGKFGNAMTFTGSANRGGGNRPQINSQIKPKWTADVPIYVRGMVLANQRLFIVGPDDVIDEEETFEKISERDKQVDELLNRQDEILNGAQGSRLLAVNADSGEVEGELALDALPVWDGLAAANQRLYLTTLAGELICIAESAEPDTNRNE